MTLHRVLWFVVYVSWFVVFLAALGIAAADAGKPSFVNDKSGIINGRFYWNDGVGKSVIYSAVEADGKLLRGKIPPGRHNYRLMVEFYRSIAHYRGFVVVTATLNPNGTYVAEGEVTKKSVTMWITDASGKRVSSIGEVSYKHCPFWPICTE